MASTASSTVPSKRNPIGQNATASMTKNVITLRTRSLTVRPISTADRDIGSERSRSMRPLLRSSARPMPVNAEPNTSDWLKMPGIRNCS